MSHITVRPDALFSSTLVLICAVSACTLTRTVKIQRPLGPAAHLDRVVELHAAAKGNTVISKDDKGHIKIWNAEKCSLDASTLDGDLRPMHEFALSADGNHIAWREGDDIFISALSSLRDKKRVASSYSRILGFSPDSSFLVVETALSHHTRIGLLDLGQLPAKQRASIEVDKDYLGSYVTADSRYVAVVHRKRVDVVSVETERVVSSSVRPGPSGYDRPQVAFGTHSDGKVYMAISAENGDIDLAVLPHGPIAILSTKGRSQSGSGPAVGIELFAATDAVLMLDERGVLSSWSFSEREPLGVEDVSEETQTLWATSADLGVVASGSRKYVQLFRAPSPVPSFDVQFGNMNELKYLAAVAGHFVAASEHEIVSFGPEGTLTCNLVDPRAR